MIAVADLAPAEAAAEAGLIYVSDSLPGIRRMGEPGEFYYVRPDGKRVEDERTLERIRSLAIPPAYKHVWVCPLENGHLQATGRDARGRKQYRYHAKFREAMEESKFGKMLEFATVLPKIRERVDQDLAKPGLHREKVLAAVVYLLERSLIRVGNEEYAKANKHYGLTTMHNRHVRVEGANIRFSFMGKSGKKHELEIHDRRIAKIVKKLQDLPGQQLFGYVDDSGVKQVTSADVNAYLREISGKDFTAKHFRTWAATVLALIELTKYAPPETKKALKARVTSVMKTVACQLGNTPAICRKSYVHPVIVQAFMDGHLHTLYRDCVANCDEAADEHAVARLLREASALAENTPAEKAYLA